MLYTACSHVWLRRFQIACRTSSVPQWCTPSSKSLQLYYSMCNATPVHALQETQPIGTATFNTSASIADPDLQFFPAPCQPGNNSIFKTLRQDLAHHHASRYKQPRNPHRCKPLRHLARPNTPYTPAHPLGYLLLMIDFHPLQHCSHISHTQTPPHPPFFRYLCACRHPFELTTSPVEPHLRVRSSDEQGAQILEPTTHTQ